jgi:chromosome partitioning protein
MSAAERVAVMEGELEGIDLVEILQVVGIGRQYTGIELRRHDQTLLGSMFIKAGKVVSAATDIRRGREAFFQLLAQVGSETRCFFHVFRTETPRDLPEPIGSLGQLLLEGLSSARNPGPRTTSGTMARAGGARPEEPGAKSINKSETIPPRSASTTAASSSAAHGVPTPPSSRARPSNVTHLTAVVEGGSTEKASTPGASRPATEVAARQGAGTSSNKLPAVGGVIGVESNTPAVRPRAGGGPGKQRIVLGVVSPKGGSGKTTIALNLALSFARQDRSVILVDADINGDVLSAIAARQRAARGAIDVLLGRASHEEALLKTVLPKLRVMPAMGAELPELSALLTPHDKGWQELLRRLSSEAEIVLVDGPAGMFGATRQFLGGCTHVLGVLQAELIASRSFTMFERALEHIPKGERPAVVGVVLNMLQSRHGASVRVLQEACEQLPKGWLLDTAIPRSDAFLEATEEGLPLRLLDEQNPPAVSWLFDTLASEISDRIGLEVNERKPRQFLI